MNPLYPTNNYYDEVALILIIDTRVRRNKYDTGVRPGASQGYRRGFRARSPQSTTRTVVNTRGPNNRNIREEELGHQEGPSLAGALAEYLALAAETPVTQEEEEVPQETREEEEDNPEDSPEYSQGTPLHRA